MDRLSVKLTHHIKYLKKLQKKKKKKKNNATTCIISVAGVKRHIDFYDICAIKINMFFSTYTCIYIYG